MRYKLLIVFNLVLFSFVVTSCYAKSERKREYRTSLKKNEAMFRDIIGDSIANVIINSRRVDISTDSSSVRRLKYTERVVARYLVTDTCNYVSDQTVYGQFAPDLCLKFEYRQKIVKILYDFRLKKLKIKGGDDELLAMYDLKSDSILRFALLVLPEDKNLNSIVKDK